MLPKFGKTDTKGPGTTTVAYFKQFFYTLQYLEKRYVELYLYFAPDNQPKFREIDKAEFLKTFSSSMEWVKQQKSRFMVDPMGVKMLIERTRYETKLHAYLEADEMAMFMVLSNSSPTEAKIRFEIEKNRTYDDQHVYSRSTNDVDIKATAIGTWERAFRSLAGFYKGIALDVNRDPESIKFSRGLTYDQKRQLTSLCREHGVGFNFRKDIDGLSIRLGGYNYYHYEPAKAVIMAIKEEKSAILRPSVGVSRHPELPH